MRHVGCRCVIWALRGVDASTGAVDAFGFDGRVTLHDRMERAITKAMKQQLQHISIHLPERVTSRGSNARRRKLVDGTSVLPLEKTGHTAESGKLWVDEL